MGFTFTQDDPFRPVAVKIGGLRVVHHANPYRVLSFPALNDPEVLLLAKRFPITLALPAAIVDQIAKTMLT